jgi:hypothetical protein
MSQELSDVEFLRMLAQHGEDNPYSGTIGVEDRAQLRSIAAKLERQAIEIDVLRTYGNKDCTAMANERLERVWSGEELWE